MFLAAINKPGRLVYFSFIQNVTVDQVRRGSTQISALLAELPGKVRILVDLDRLESMEIACAKEFGKTMELLDEHGVELVVRVISNPAKDIGLNILSAFHYRHRPRTVVCESMQEAGKFLGL